MKQGFILLILVACLLQCGCDLKRDNPLDPAGGYGVSVPPTLVPAEINITSSVPRTVDISWVAKPDLQGYNLYRCERVDGEYIQLNKNIITAVSYVDNDRLASGFTYYYRISCVNTIGLEGYLSTPKGVRVTK